MQENRVVLYYVMVIPYYLLTWQEIYYKIVKDVLKVK